MTITAYRSTSLVLACVFAIVGLMFLFLSTDILLSFDRISESLGLETASVGGDRFYVILSVAYMYLVTLFAFFMYRRPENTVYPFLLFNGKMASSVVSFALFLIDRHLLIYAVNGVLDACIAVLVLGMYRSLRRASR